MTDLSGNLPPSEVLYTGTPPVSWDYAREPGDPMWGPPALADSEERRKRYRAQLEGWINDPYTLDPRWQARAKREVNEDPATARDNVRNLRERLRGEKGLNSRMDDHFLLAFLRAKRHDPHTAHLSVLKYYRMRKLNPPYFELCLPSENIELFETGAASMLEGYDVLGRPICYLTVDFPPGKVMPNVFMQLIVQLMEFLILDPRVQVSGLTILCNLAKQSLAHTRQVTIKFLKLMLQIFQGTFPVRIKRIVICHGSFLFRTTYAITKPFIHEKFKERIVILGNDVSVLPTFFPVEVIPPALKGTAEPLRPTAFAERLTLVEDWLIEWHKYGYEEGAALTLSKEKSQEFVEAGLEEPRIPLSDTDLQKEIQRASKIEKKSSHLDEIPDLPDLDGPILPVAGTSRRSDSFDHPHRQFPDSNLSPNVNASVTSDLDTNLIVSTDAKPNVTPNSQPPTDSSDPNLNTTPNIQPPTDSSDPNLNVTPKIQPPTDSSDPNHTPNIQPNPVNPDTNLTPNIQPNPSSASQAPSDFENQEFEKCSDRKKARLKAAHQPPK